MMPTETVLSPLQRRVLTWGSIVFILALGAALGTTLLRRAASGLLFGQRSEAHITQEFVVERLREVAKLVASEMTLRDVVTYEQTELRSTKRTLLVVTARVSAGINLAHNTDVHIDAVAKRITIVVPPAEVTSVDVVNVTTYDEQAGLWNPFRAEDRDVIQQRIRTQLKTAALQSGILEHADQSAARVLTELLSRDGYTVEIRRPPAPRPLIG
ncbi:MAG: DUF4230 domain-containing protein [Polaromonas sp.]|nr:DUF4230 domain-containing protein [Gemmatimonadaceae bacterium]